MNTNFESAKKWIELKLKSKDNVESISGPGSFIENTKNTCSLINETLIKYNIKSILDLGCGDFNYFKSINIDNISYIGWDVSTQMINENINKYGNKYVKFEVKDIITDEYPHVDLIICRDVFFHLDKSFTIRCLEKIKKKCKYFISTSFNNVKKNGNLKNYNNIDNWGFYPINLNISPFYLNDNIKKIVCEKNIKNKSEPRFINLYIF
jgi:2-polyprenyl-3-methyl-5-hydroxy-6-metoxy-1,4-benzoquinol methylase